MPSRRFERPRSTHGRRHVLPQSENSCMNGKQIQSRQQRSAALALMCSPSVTATTSVLKSLEGSEMMEGMSVIRMESLSDSVSGASSSSVRGLRTRYGSVQHAHSPPPTQQPPDSQQAEGGFSLQEAHQSVQQPRELNGTWNSAPSAKSRDRFATRGQVMTNWYPTVMVPTIGTSFLMGVDSTVIAMDVPASTTMLSICSFPEIGINRSSSNV
mmetsp:Transcript_42124/g.136710  ORF Transcript_42124/g.136710 Transcript_42124/m.136710 type:complete len:213 (+) Transcript_42124:176-814(+)